MHGDRKNVWKSEVSQDIQYLRVPERGKIDRRKKIINNGKFSKT